MDQELKGEFFRLLEVLASPSYGVVPSSEASDECLLSDLGREPWDEATERIRVTPVLRSNSIEAGQGQPVGSVKAIGHAGRPRRVEEAI